MARFKKTNGQTLFALASTAASSVSLGTAVDVSTALGGLVYVRFGRRSATAAGAGANIRLEASHSSSADNSWFPFAVFTTAFAACEAEAVSGTVNAGTAITTGRGATRRFAAIWPRRSIGTVGMGNGTAAPGTTMARC
jgi:hypothetical protein